MRAAWRHEASFRLEGWLFLVLFPLGLWLGGGMLTSAPRLASILAFASVASLGLPGLAGFWGEMLALLGAYRFAGYKTRPSVERRDPVART